MVPLECDYSGAMPKQKLYYIATGYDGTAQPKRGEFGSVLESRRDGRKYLQDKKLIWDDAKTST